MKCRLHFEYVPNNTAVRVNRMALDFGATNNYITLGHLVWRMSAYCLDQSVRL